MNLYFSANHGQITIQRNSIGNKVVSCNKWRTGQPFDVQTKNALKALAVIEIG